MKLVILTVILYVAIAEARYIEWRPGYKYIYDYFGYQLDAIDGVGSRQVGFAMDGTVTIYGLDDDYFILQLGSWRTATFDEDVQTEEWSIEWGLTSITGLLTYYLSLPVKVQLKGGNEQVIEVSKDDSPESLNIKKAILTMLRISITNNTGPRPPANIKLNSLHKRYSSQVNSSTTTKYAVKRTTLTEDGVGGKCKATYVTTREPSLWNPDADVLNITKEIDYDECESRPVWARSSLVPNQCAQCDSNTMHPFQTVNRFDYNIKLKDSQMLLETVVGVAHTLLKPFTGKANYLRVKQIQALALASVAPSEVPAPKVFSPLLINTLQYQFPTAVRAGTPSLKDPLTPFINDDKINAVFEGTNSFGKLIVKIAAEELFSIYDESITIDVYNVIRTIRLMNYQQVSQFYRNVAMSEGQTISGRSSFNPTSDRVEVATQLLVMSGSPPAILYFKFLIESKLVADELAIQAIQSISSNIFEPSHELLSEILSLAKHNAVNESSQLMSTIWLSFGILVSKACNTRTVPLPPNKADYCPPDIKRKLLNEINQKLQAAKTLQEVLLFIRVLGSTELADAITFLLPFISDEDNEDLEIVQLVALHALKDIAKSAPEEARTIAESVFYKSINHNNVRIAALRVIMATNPDFSFLQRIVMWLAKEPSKDVAGFLVSYLDNIGNASHYCLNHLANDVRQLMSLVDKKLYNGIQGSNYKQWSQTFDELGISTQSEASWIASESSIVPEDFHFVSNVTVSGYSYEPIEFGYTVKGLQHVINNLIGPVANFKNNRTLEDIFKPEFEEPDRHRSQINEKLMLETRHEDPFLFSAFLKLGDTQARVAYFDYLTIVEAIKDGLAGQSKLIHQSLHIHRLSLFNELELQVPSALGVPLLVHMFNPSIISVNGNVSAEVDFEPGHGHSHLPETIKLEVKLKPSYTSQTVLRLGMYNPFTKRTGVVGVQSFTYVNLPVTAKIDADMVAGLVHFNFKPYPENSLTTKWVKTRVEPYSCQYAFNTTTDNCQSRNLIHKDSKPVEGEIDLAKSIFGLPLTIKYVREVDWSGWAAFLSSLDEYNDIFSFINTQFQIPEFAISEHEITGDGSEVLDQEMNVTLSWFYTPTPIEQLVLESMNNSYGFWTAVSGFARLPQRCNSKTSIDHENSDLSEGTSGVIPLTGDIVSSTVETFKREDEVSNLELIFKVSANGNALSHFHGRFAMQRNLDTLIDDISITAELLNFPSLTNDTIKICTNGTIKYPVMHCDVLSQMNPNDIKLVDINFHASWGEECDTESQAKIIGILEKTNEQKEIEEEKDEWYNHQCQKDLDNGMKLSEACELLIFKLSLLNKIKLIIEYNTMPNWLQNITNKLDTYLKVRNYLHMTNNPGNVSNGEGLLIINGFKYQKVDVFDLQLNKPTENTFYSMVPYDTPYFYPVSTLTTVHEQWLDEITNGLAWPTCKVMGDHVKTFDNNTLTIPLIKCHQVIAKDCSPHDLFAVTMSGINETKILNVYILSHVVQIRPQSLKTGQFHIDFDGKVLKPTNDEVVTVKTMDKDAPDKVVAVFVTTSPILYIQLPLTGVIIKFDGQDTEIIVSQVWRGRVCGLCSNFIGETLEDLIGPDQCLHPDPVSFGIGYAIPTFECEVPHPPSSNKLCEVEQLNQTVNRPPPYGLDLSEPAPMAMTGARPPLIVAPLPQLQSNSFTKKRVPKVPIDPKCKKCSTLGASPVCGNDEVTYENFCFLICAAGRNPALGILCYGSCPCSSDPRLAFVKGDQGLDFNKPFPKIKPRPWGPSVAVNSSSVLPRSSCNCPAVYAPVCGSNNATYGNKCFFECDKRNNEDLTIQCKSRCPCQFALTLTPVRASKFDRSTTPSNSLTPPIWFQPRMKTLPPGK